MTAQDRKKFTMQDLWRAIERTPAAQQAHDKETERLRAVKLECQPNTYQGVL